ncbi:MAG: phosphoribosyltransferase [Acidobacteria bacterium]|nr:phosphoribosyltransferase [Acidobacteriota bacterium]
MEVYSDRREAGRVLAQRLGFLRGPDVVVLGLPRGGVPIAAEVAIALHAPLDVIGVRKLGLPFQPELAMGAIGEEGVTVREEQVLAAARVSPSEFATVERAERQALNAAVARFRRGRSPLVLTGKVAVIVDDGLATGSTARAACHVARQRGAATIVVAVPVAPAEVVASFSEADQVIAAATPEPFSAVGYHYRDFRPTSDEEVVTALDAAARRVRLATEDPTPADFDGEITFSADGVELAGHLHLPEPTRAVVIFAHGSGSSRWSPRNRYVAELLYEAGMGTLLMDLLTPAEERNRDFVFDIELLAQRLVAATHWLRARPGTVSAAIGYFGASTGAGAALVAAAEVPGEVSAVVSRGGRPDLARDHLEQVRTPTLLIVGGHDPDVLALNRQALARITAPSRLAVVPGATHLFEEPGTLAEAAGLARDFFALHLLSRGDAGVER